MKSFKQFLIEQSYKSIQPDDLFEDWFNTITSESTMHQENFSDEYKEYDDIKYHDITNIPKFKTYMYDIFINMFNNFSQNLQNILHNNNNKIPIFRALTINDNFFHHLQNTQSPKLGIYWSWDKYSAEAHNGDFKKPKLILIHSEINESDVDWKSTFMANTHTSLDTEKEITLYKNTPLQILAITDYRSEKPYDISNIRNKTFRA
jgi:hypothetical protein